MSDLRREIEGIIKQSTLGGYAMNDGWNKELATALEALFEQRIEPLRKVYEQLKYIPKNSPEWTSYYDKGNMWQAIKQVVEGGEK
jgi:hypothetical protein